MNTTIARAVRRATTVLLAGTILVAVTGTSASAAEKNPGGKGGKKTESTKEARGGKNGANGDCGDYCSTRDGSPSRNGNGDGKSTGRPCAGCVGKADDKNPPGQYRNGSDANNGYECDGNSGIARGNPAHTGCTTAPAPAVTPAQPKPVVVPAQPETVVVVTPVTPKAPAAPAAVLGTRFERPGFQPVAEAAPAGAQVLGTRFTAPARSNGTLPLTGGTTSGLLLAAVALLVAGAGALIVASRRQTV